MYDVQKIREALKWDSDIDIRLVCGGLIVAYISSKY